MFDTETILLLRFVLDEVCQGVSCSDTSVRAHIASCILAAAAKGETSMDSLMQAGQEALNAMPVH